MIQIFAANYLWASNIQDEFLRFVSLTIVFWKQYYDSFEINSGSPSRPWKSPIRQRSWTIEIDSISMVALLTITRSYYRKESAAVTHKLENSQPIINIEIDNNTLYVLIYFISKCLDYSTVITTRHYITVNGVFIFTAPYCTVRSI